MMLQRQKVMSLVSRTKIQPKTIANFISSRRLGFHALFHTQTVHWRTDEEVVECCQLFSFRPLDSNPLQALTANDTTRSTAALHHIRTGEALVYTGGDYHNARQLLQAVKRKIAGTSSSPRRKKRAKEKKKITGAVETNTAPFVVGNQWMKQRQLQRDQSELVHKIFIQVSLEDGRPSQIMGLKRTPTNVKDIFSYAFQNDKVMNVKGGEISSSSQPKYFLASLADFLAMVGGYEWHRKGVYIDALQDYIFPHFGVFPPTRQDYIQLMDNINVDRTTRQNPIRMMEIGIGSGVLSIILLQRKKVDRVIGTDINPYAIACAKANMQQFGFQEDLILADLFPPKAATTNEEKNRKVDVVLFNPPWIPGNAATWLDQAVYDPDQNLLRRFLLQVQHHVTEDGHVYLLLSNLGMLLGLFEERDLYAMFQEGNLELVEVHTTKSKAEMSKSRPTKKMGKKSKHHLDAVESVKAQEVISLYYLRVSK